jgi:cytochrome P450
MSSLDSESHRCRRDLVARPYLKRHLQNSQRFHRIVSVILLERLGPRISNNDSREPIIVEALSLCFATSADIVSGYIFGLTIAPNLIEDQARAGAYQRAYSKTSSRKTMFWDQEVPLMSSLMSCLCPYLRRSHKDKLFLEAEVFSLCAKAKDLNAPSEESTSYPELYQHMKDKDKTLTQVKAASEILDHLKATGEVLSITITQALYELSRNQDIQSELRSELWKLWYPAKAGYIPLGESLDALPLLDAVVRETLRLRPNAPDAQPRTNLQFIPDLCGYQIPAKIRVSTYPSLLHRIGPFEARPDVWDPKRWLKEEKEKRNENEETQPRLWAFGIDARNCLGKDMALQG